MEVIDRLLITFQNSSTWFWTAVTDQPSRESRRILSVSSPRWIPFSGWQHVFRSAIKLKHQIGRNVKHGITKEIRDKNIFGRRLTGTALVIWCRNISIQKMDTKSWAGFCNNINRGATKRSSTDTLSSVHSFIRIALELDWLSDWLTDCAQCFSCKVWWHGERIAERISIKTLFYLMKISKQNRRVSQLVEMMTRRSREFPKKPLKSRLACWVSSRRSGLELQ